MANHFLFGYWEDQIKMGYQAGDETFALDQERIPSLTWLLQNVSANDLLSTLQNACSTPLDRRLTPTLRDIFDRQPIWAAGVTYKISEEARERESDNSTIYTRVYHAERPELFLKALGYNVVSSGEKVGIRADATWSVPEPELTIILNSQLEVFGFTIGNDMSSRDIEGANPLYLPQAKVYDRACALGPRIWLLPGVGEWPELPIYISIERNGMLVFKGETSTQRLNRTLPALVHYLGRSQQFPYGAALMTGTGVVPSDEFTLQEGDTVRISVPPIGELVNPVQIVGDPRVEIL